MMFDNDRYRATGRTTRMLLKAILEFLEGSDIIFASYDFRYSTELAKRAYDILRATEIRGVEFNLEKREIVFNNCRMQFVPFDLKDGYWEITRGRSNVQIFEDHANPKGYRW